MVHLLTLTIGTTNRYAVTQTDAQTDTQIHISLNYSISTLFKSLCNRAKVFVLHVLICGFCGGYWVKGCSRDILFIFLGFFSRQFSICLVQILPFTLFPLAHRHLLPLSFCWSNFGLLQLRPTFFSWVDLMRFQRVWLIKCVKKYSWEEHNYFVLTVNLAFNENCQFKREICPCTDAD